MGTKNDKKLLILIGLLLVTCVLVYSQSREARIVEKDPLKQYFLQIEGYQTARMTEMSDDIITMLKLDDYVFADYQGPHARANLYIGYYYSSSKAYAAHSPMICYPSQGWQIDSQPRQGTLQVGPHTIKYEEITTSFGDTKELVIYWYQAGLSTNTQIYRNKIDMGYNKLRHNMEEHGFVRVAVPVVNDLAEAQKAATEFIQAFYPQLIQYIAQPTD